MRIQIDLIKSLIRIDILDIQNSYLVKKLNVDILDTSLRQITKANVSSIIIGKYHSYYFVLNYKCTQTSKQFNNIQTTKFSVFLPLAMKLVTYGATISGRKRYELQIC